MSKNQTLTPPSPPAAATPVDLSKCNMLEFWKDKRVRDGYAPVLKAHNISPEIFFTAMIAEIGASPDLMNCKNEQVNNLVRDIATAGLLPGKLAGKAYLIPYKGVCKLQISYKGYVEIFGRHKIRITPGVIRANDIYKEKRGTEQSIIHEIVDLGNRGDIVGVYVVFSFPDGYKQFYTMSKAEADQIRDNHSESFKYGKGASVWDKHYEAMALKTVIKRGAKYISVPFEVEQAITVDDKLYMKANAIEAEFTTEVPPSNFAAQIEQQNANTVPTNITTDPDTGEITEDGELDIDPEIAKAAEKFGG